MKKMKQVQLGDKHYMLPEIDREKAMPDMCAYLRCDNIVCAVCIVPHMKAKVIR